MLPGFASQPFGAASCWQTGETNTSLRRREGNLTTVWRRPRYRPCTSAVTRAFGVPCGGGRVELNVGAAPVLGKVLRSAIKVFGRELEDPEPEGGGIAAQPLDRLFSEALEAWKMMAAARSCLGGRWVVVRGLGGPASSVTGGRGRRRWAIAFLSRFSLTLARVIGANRDRGRAHRAPGQ